MSPRSSVSYSQASIRVANYKESFKTQLSAFSRHCTALVAWSQSLVSGAALEPDQAAEGRTRLDAVAVSVATLLAMTEVPLRAVERQLAATRAAFASLHARPTVDAADVAHLGDAIFSLGNGIKSMLALNVLAHRGSVCAARGPRRWNPVAAMHAPTHRACASSRLWTRGGGGGRACQDL